jgi:hypothetical protein
MSHKFLVEPLAGPEEGTYKGTAWHDEWYPRQDRLPRIPPEYLVEDQIAFDSQPAQQLVHYFQKTLENLGRVCSEADRKERGNFNRQLWGEFQRFLSCLIPVQLAPTTSVTYARVLQEVLRVRFEALAAEWREDTGHLSVDSDITSHPAYLGIIGMGAPVLPLILEDLGKTGDFWFTALEAITGEDPVPLESRGKIKMVANAWLDWGRNYSVL